MAVIYIPRTCGKGENASLEAECRGREQTSALHVARSLRSVASRVSGIDCDSCSPTNSTSCVGLLISMVISRFVDEA